MQQCLVGTLSYSDPETGSHFWYPISSSAERVEGGWKMKQACLLDDVGRFRGLVYRADHQPGLQRRLLELVVFPHHG